MRILPLIALLLLLPLEGLSQPGVSTTFLVRIENISQEDTLQAPSGNVALPLAPGVWVVHTDARPLFASGFADPGLGLEALAEDGNPAPLAASLSTQAGVINSAVFNTPTGASEPGPLLPGNAYEFVITASRGAQLSFAAMFVQSNDLFYAPNELGLALFDSRGLPVEGDVTSAIRLWDAGTEVNQPPGIGLDQAPRQVRPNVGQNENGVVRQVNDDDEYPEVDEVIRVTITPQR